MITECAILGTKADGSLSQFADDLARKLVVKDGTAQGAARIIEESDLLLDETLATSYKQNNKTQRHRERER